MSSKNDCQKQELNVSKTIYSESFKNTLRDRMRAECGPSICPNPIPPEELIQILTNTLTDKDIQYLVDKGVVCYEDDEDGNGKHLRPTRSTPRS